jgi:hypothetical protein
VSWGELFLVRVGHRAERTRIELGVPELGRSGDVPTQLECEPGPGGTELPFHGGQRHADRLGSFFQGEPPEISLFQNASPAFVNRLEALERFVEVGNVLELFLRQPQDVVERRRGSTQAALGRLPGPGVIDQEMPHNPGDQTQKMASIARADLGRIRQRQIGLMHQRGGVQGSIGFLPEVLMGEPPHPFVGQGKRLIERLGITGGPAAEQAGEVGRVGRSTLVERRWTYLQADSLPEAAGGTPEPNWRGLSATQYSVRSPCCSRGPWLVAPRRPAAILEGILPARSELRLLKLLHATHASLTGGSGEAVPS